MTRWVVLLTIGAGLASAGSAFAQSIVIDKCNGAECTTCCPATKHCGCPDDYCRKPWPRIWCAPCGEPDCYCGKPWPRIWSLSCGECAVYCRKPCPQLCRPLR